jgi:hypothetical protein
MVETRDSDMTVKDVIGGLSPGESISLSILGEGSRASPRTDVISIYVEDAPNALRNDTDTIIVITTLIPSS